MSKNCECYLQYLTVHEDQILRVHKVPGGKLCRTYVLLASRVLGASVKSFVHTCHIPGHQKKKNHPRYTYRIQRFLRLCFVPPTQGDLRSIGCPYLIKYTSDLPQLIGYRCVLFSTKYGGAGIGKAREFYRP